MTRHARIYNRSRQKLTVNQSGQSFPFLLTSGLLSAAFTVPKFIQPAAKSFLFTEHHLLNINDTSFTKLSFSFQKEIKPKLLHFQTFVLHTLFPRPFLEVSLPPHIFHCPLNKTKNVLKPFPLIQIDYNFNKSRKR